MKELKMELCVVSYDSWQMQCCGASSKIAYFTASTLDLAILIGSDCPTASISIMMRCLPFILMNLPTRSFICPDLILTSSPSLKSS